MLLRVRVLLKTAKTALVDGPKSINGAAELKRHVMPLKRLSITNIKCNILPGARVKALDKAITDAGVVKKWAASSWSKGIAQKKAKANMSKCRATERATERA